MRSAIVNSGFEFPLGRIVVNLAPADVKKIGSLLDLPIAIGILACSKQINSEYIEDYILFGELSLAGDIKGVKGTLPIILAGVSEGKINFVLPYENLNEFKYVKGTLPIILAGVSEGKINFVLPYENLNEFKYSKEAKYYPLINLKESISFLQRYVAL